VNEKQTKEHKMRQAWLRRASALAAALVLAACGGGGDSNGNSTVSQSAATAATQDPGAPQATGNTASDGLAWFNYRRQQIGLTPLYRNALIDAAAQGHSDYQKLNNVITHVQTPGKPGFTGVQVNDRLVAAGYILPKDDYAFGEVISSTSSTSGFTAAEDLIAAIYHRFLILEPMFREAGAGAATVPGGSTYFTTNFAVIGLNGGLKAGTVVSYPYPGQQRVPPNFFSDNESPDPVPNRNEVGYPISVHGNIVSTLLTTSFSVRPRGGAPLAVQLLTNAGDTHTPTSAAAIIPLNRLASATTYDVDFTGSIDGAPITRSWSFTTQ
jgi:uncharacterized protein YkwD